MRYLSLDLGEQRIGVAISDSIGMLARPLNTFKRTSREADFNHIAKLVEEHNIAAIIMGLPLNMDGTEGPQAAWVRDYSAALATALQDRGAATAIPVQLWDERLSTEEAEEIMRAQGKRPDKTRIDAVAAAVILQSYLDAQRREITKDDQIIQY
jgi:putative Holliday junction resolvase